MDRALVVLEDDPGHRTTLQEAAQHAGAVDADLRVFTTVTEEELEGNVETLGIIGSIENTGYGEKTGLEAVRAEVRERVDSIVDSQQVEWDLELRVADEDERADEIVNAARETDCDHVYLAGRKRSPTGKALFGDVTQSVILNFDGFVTVSMNE